MALYQGQPGGVMVHTKNGSYQLQYDDVDMGHSSPAQLAAVLLKDVYNKQVAIEFYQEFKQCVVSKLKDDWTLDESIIKNWVKERRFQSGKVD